MENNVLPVTKDIVKNILSNRNNELKIIRDKIYKVQLDIKDTDELIEIATFSSGGISDMPKGKGGHHDLGDTYLRYLKMLENRNSEYKTLLWNMMLQEDRIERVWQSFLMLGDPYYSLLQKLYVEGEKYEVAEREYEHSRASFENHRNQAINMIIQFYESDLTIQEIEKLAAKAKLNRKEVSSLKKMDGQNQQITIEDWIQELKEN